MTDDANLLVATTPRPAPPVAAAARASLAPRRPVSRSPASLGGATRIALHVSHTPRSPAPSLSLLRCRRRRRAVSALVAAGLACSPPRLPGRRHRQGMRRLSTRRRGGGRRGLSTDMGSPQQNRSPSPERRPHDGYGGGVPAMGGRCDGDGRGVARRGGGDNGGKGAARTKIPRGRPFTS